MSTYAFALLTKRHFRLYITHPCKLTSLILPNKINWNSKITRNGQDLQLFSNLSRSYIYAIDKQEYKIKFSKENFLNYESNKDVIIIRGNNDWLQSFAQNKFVKSEILKLGLWPENFNLIYLFKQWYDELFKLTPILQIKYESFRQKARVTNKTQIICAQVRIGGKRPNVRFDYKYNDLNVTKLFWKFIREKLLSEIKDDDWKLFITTDTELVEQEAVKEFGSRKIIKIPGLFTHIDRETNSNNDCHRIEKTILDFHFMQNCDKAVISKSGYGKLGLLNRNDPLKNLFMFDKNSFNKVDYSVTA
jgi:hypothetical protein